MKSIKFKKQAVDLLFFIVGAIFYSVSVNTFTAPNELVLGGVTGIATIINHFAEIPIGVLIIVFNIPLFFISFREFGKYYLFKMLWATLISGFMIDALEPLLPRFEGDLLLASLYGGVFTGVGIGLIMLRGGSTGGVDTIAMVVNKKNPGISIGRVFLVFDFAVVLLSGTVYGNFSVMLYSLIIIFTSTKVIDSVLYGLERGGTAMIITSKDFEISNIIFEKTGRGVTILDAVGGYTGKGKKIVMCAARKNEISRIERLVASVDKESFVIITEASKIAGEGFYPDR